MLTSSCFHHETDSELTGAVSLLPSNSHSNLFYSYNFSLFFFFFLYLYLRNLQLPLSSASWLFLFYFFSLFRAKESLLQHTSRSNKYPGILWSPKCLSLLQPKVCWKCLLCF